MTALLIHKTNKPVAIPTAAADRSLRASLLLVAETRRGARLDVTVHIKRGLVVLGRGGGDRGLATSGLSEWHNMRVQHKSVHKYNTDHNK